jgi:hypothetical protein
MDDARARTIASVIRIGGISRSARRRMSPRPPGPVGDASGHRSFAHGVGSYRVQPHSVGALSPGRTVPAVITMPPGLAASPTEWAPAVCNPIPQEPCPLGEPSQR